MEYKQEKSAAQIPGGKTASIENKNWSVRESFHDRIDSMAHPWHYIDVYSCLYVRGFSYTHNDSGIVDGAWIMDVILCWPGKYRTNAKIY